MFDEVLELETRRAIYKFIKEFPGFHMREIERTLKMSIALVEYHLNYLETAEVIVSITDGGYKRYYIQPKAEDGSEHRFGQQERRILGLLRQKIPLQIVLYLLKNKQATHTKISDELKISPSKLSFHLKKLLARGVVAKLGREDGKAYIVENEGLVIKLLVMHKPPHDMLVEFSELWESLDIG